jgi:hypothetical protein
MEWDLSCRVGLPRGAALACRLPFISVREVPSFLGYDAAGMPLENKITAPENLRWGDVLMGGSWAGKLSRFHAGLGGAVKLATGLSPYEEEGPLLATGTGSRDHVFSAGLGLRLGALWLAGGLARENRRPFRVDNYLYLLPGSQEVDPGDVTTARAAMRLNLFRDRHQEAYLSCAYDQRRQEGERAGGVQWSTSEITRSLLTELEMLFRGEFLLQAGLTSYGLDYVDGSFTYQGVSFSLRAVLLFGG